MVDWPTKHQLSYGTGIVKHTLFLSGNLTFAWFSEGRDGPLLYPHGIRELGQAAASLKYAAAGPSNAI